ncbi:MAG TPA: sulfatase [Gemmatimonadales bacterium]|nr:sulfatase [Gemmatimonadales bacterium]
MTITSVESAPVGSRSGDPGPATPWLLHGRLGTWLGLAYGFVEAGQFMLLALVPGALSWRTGNSAHVLWVAPLVYAAAFGALGLLVDGAARVWRRGWWETALVSGLALLGAYLAGSLQGQILSGTAAAVLAAGIASVACRLWRRRGDAWRPIMLRTVPHLLGTVAAFAGLTLGARWWTERRALAALPTGNDRPNVLLLVIDTQRADHLSAYGYRRPTTPTLDRFAREGTLFENASATSSWTLPAHATLMTGRLLHEHRAGIMRRPYLDDRFPTLAEVLRGAGYATGGFVANTFWCGRQTGLDRGFIRYEDFYGKPGDAVARTVLGRRLAYEWLPRFGLDDVPGRKRAEDLNRDLLEWIDGIGERPFFAFVNYFDVHAPLVPPPGFAGRFSGDPRRRRRGEVDIGALTAERKLPPPDALRRMVDEYDESLLYLDSQLERLFAELDRRGILDRTLVVVTSDHGESWGEHGLLYHGHSLYRNQTHVPLIVRFPGRVPGGLRAGWPVGLDQVPVTVGELVGIGSTPFPGRSLFDSLAAGPVLSEVGRRNGVPKAWPTGRGSVASLTTAEWHYIEIESGEAELYDLRHDPGERRNLAGDPALTRLVSGFRERLARTLVGSGLSWGAP